MVNGVRRAGMRAGIVTLCLLAAACEPPTDPLAEPPRRLVVHAVLDAGASAQTVKVQYLDGSFGHTLTNVAGAEVSITTPDGRVFHGQESGTSGSGGLVYSVTGLNRAEIVPGGTYLLRVRTQAGEEASGTTTMPAFTVVPNQPITVSRFERARDTLRLTWSSVPLAKRYQVSIQTSFVDDGRLLSFSTYRVFSDTGIVIAGTARTLENEPVFLEGTNASVLVAAVDDNYYRYYHPNVDPFAGAPPSNLTGAIGVFGSVVPVRAYSYQVR